MTWRLTFFVILIVLGSVMTWNAAPRLESRFFPVLDNVYLVPIDPEHPDVFVTRDVKFACWRQHILKTRRAVSRRWAMTIILPDGTRYYTAPIDGRTMHSSSSKDVYNGGFEGVVPVCARVPDDVLQHTVFDIESMGVYETDHHLWFVEQHPLIIHVPASAGVP